MSLFEASIARGTAALETDVTATLGAVHATYVADFARHVRQFVDDDGSFAQRLVDEVQQYFHDTFVDTTWPACPRHPNHPVWFHDNAWWCDEELVATLGELRSR